MTWDLQNIHGNSHIPKSIAISPLCPECMNPMSSGKNKKIMRSITRLPVQPNTRLFFQLCHKSYLILLYLWSSYNGEVPTPLFRHDIRLTLLYSTP